MHKLLFVTKVELAAFYGKSKHPTIQMLTDVQLIHKIINGDQRAFSRLVARYQNHMYTVCYNILKTKPEAQEATQDTFLKAYKALAGYKEDAKFSSWLYKIAYRTSLDLIRKRKKTTDISEVSSGLADKSSTAHTSMEESEFSRELDHAIMQLDPKEAGMIKMFYLEELSTKELAEITGESLSNVKVILYRARKKLAAIIKEQYSEMENYIN